MQRALRTHPEWLVRSSREGNLEELLVFIREQVQGGFRDSGWPRAEVRTSLSEDQASIVVDVVEGPYVTLAEIEVHGAAIVDAAVIRQALNRGGRVGKALRFGKRGRSMAWQSVESVYHDLGFAAPKGSIGIRWLDGDRAVLEVKIEDEPSAVSQTIRFDGQLEDDPDLILERIGVQAGTPIAADDLLERIRGLGRYADVEVARGEGADLVVRLAQIPGGPGWQQMPWDEVAAFHRAARTYAESFGSGQRELRIRGPISELGAQSPGEIELGVRNGKLWFAVEGLEVGGRALPTLSLAFDGRRFSLLFGDQVTSIAASDELGLRAHAALNVTSKGRIQLLWGVHLWMGAMQSNCSVDEALYVAMSARKDFEIERNEDRMVFRTPPGSVLTWDREVGQVDVSFGLFENTAFEVSTEAVAARAGGDSAQPSSARELSLPAMAEILRQAVAAAATPRDFELWSIAARELSPTSSDDQSSSRGYAFLSEPGQSIHLGLTLVRELEAGLEPGTWPCVLARYVRYTLGLPSREAQSGIEAEWQAVDRSRLGPLSALLHAVVFRGFVADSSIRRSVAQSGLERMEFDAFFEDLQVLACGGNWLDRYLQRVGRAWHRADLGFESGADEATALREGLRRIWRAGLGDLLRGALQFLSK